MTKDATDVIKEGGQLQLPEPDVKRWSVYDTAVDAFRQRPIMKTGLRLIDTHLGGGELGELVLVVGEEGVGKSSFGLYWANRAASKGTQAGYIPLEDSHYRVGARVVSMHAGFDDRLARLSAAGAYTISDTTEKAIKKAQDSLAKVPMYVYQPKQNTPSLVFEAAKKAAQDGCKIIFLDYISRIAYGSEESHTAVMDFALAFEALGREYGFIPVVFQQLHPRGKDSDGKATRRLKGAKALADISRIVIALDRYNGELLAEMIKSTDGLTNKVQKFDKHNGVFQEVR